MNKWATKERRAGGRKQAGIPTQPRRLHFDRANGLLLRGVVVATYVSDDDNHPERTEVSGTEPVAIYCDVLVYSSKTTQRWVFLPAVLVLQDRGGMHSGRIWKPRAATVDKGDTDLDLDAQANPADLDGDHVLVGFIDDNLNAPVILGGIPHPSNDEGNASKPVGQRMRLKVADGDPDFWKHRGAYYGIDDAAGFLVDLSQAHSGQFDAQGKEPSAPQDGSIGNIEMKAQNSALAKFLVDGGKGLWIKAAEMAMGVENPSDWVALASLVNAELEALKTTINNFITAHQAPGSHTTTATIGPSAVLGVVSSTIGTLHGTINNVKSATVKSE